MMPDRENVINGLECCYCNFPKQMDCKNCPYDKICYHDKACSLMLRDALELLKEQQQQIWELQDQVEYLTDKQKKQGTVSAHWDDDTGHWIEGDRNGIDPHTRTTGEMIDTFRCSWCGFYQYWKTPFCPNCGAKMEGR